MEGRVKPSDLNDLILQLIGSFVLGNVRVNAICRLPFLLYPFIYQDKVIFHRLFLPVCLPTIYHSSYKRTLPLDYQLSRHEDQQEE